MFIYLSVPSLSFILYILTYLSANENNDIHSIMVEIGAKADDKYIIIF